MIKIVKDKQLIDDVHQYDVVLFGMGINNAMNKGFSYDIALNFSDVRDSENSTKYGDLSKYGTVHVTVVNNISFCACYVYSLTSKGVTIDYDALRKALELIKNHFHKKKIVSPIIGQDKYDGNGDKEKILNIYREVFDERFDVTLYDFVQHDFATEIYKQTLTLRKQYREKLITKEEFLEGRRKLEWRRTHGIFEDVPDDYEYKPKVKNKQKF